MLVLLPSSGVVETNGGILGVDVWVLRRNRTCGKNEKLFGWRLIEQRSWCSAICDLSGHRETEAIVVMSWTKICAVCREREKLLGGSRLWQCGERRMFQETHRVHCLDGVSIVVSSQSPKPPTPQFLNKSSSARPSLVKYIRNILENKQQLHPPEKFSFKAHSTHFLDLLAQRA